MEYQLAANRKTIEGEANPDRNTQFEFINEQSKTIGIAGGLRKPPKRGLKIEITLFSHVHLFLVLYIFPDLFFI
jgi:hypothetical protein